MNLHNYMERKASFRFKLLSFGTNGMETGPGARFSKVPVTSGPDNLSGPLSGNFIGPDIAFLEAPVNFPGNYRAR